MGVCLITSKKKKPFLSEKGFYIKKGFKVVDTVLDYELLDLNFAGNSPRFGEEAKKFQIVSPNLTIYYSDQCPYINNCIKEIKEYCTEKKIILDLIKIDTVEKAKKLPCIFNNWAVFKEGKYVTNVLLNRNSLDKLYN